MHKVDLKNYKKDLSGLFKSFEWNYIPGSILEGSMGEILVDDLENPKTAILTIPEFKISFLGGDAKADVVKEYLKELPFFSTLMFVSEGWPSILKSVHPKKWLAMPRFPFSSESLDVTHLKELKDRLSDEYRIEKIDLEIAKQIMSEKNKLTGEQLFGFENAENFIERGIGYIAYAGEEMVCISAAGTATKKGIEIQVNTLSEREGQGLGTAVSAALIIDCLEQGIDPNWDAATKNSAGLAKKLGYTPEGQYLVYVFTKYKILAQLVRLLRRILKREIIEP